MKTAHSHPLVDRVFSQAKFNQLPSCNHPMLPPRKLGDAHVQATSLR